MAAGITPRRLLFAAHVSWTPRLGGGRQHSGSGLASIPARQRLRQDGDKQDEEEDEFEGDVYINIHYLSVYKINK